MSLTPGTPYAAHFHWRWGEVYYKGSWKPGFPSGTQKQFGGIGGAGGPMVHPKNPDQDFNLAVTLEKGFDVSKDFTAGIYNPTTYSWKIDPLNMNEPFSDLLDRVSGKPLLRNLVTNSFCGLMLWHDPNMHQMLRMLMQILLKALFL